MQRLCPDFAVFTEAALQEPYERPEGRRGSPPREFILRPNGRHESQHNWFRTEVDHLAITLTAWQYEHGRTTWLKAKLYHRSPQALPGCMTLRRTVSLWFRGAFANRSHVNCYDPPAPSQCRQNSSPIGRYTPSFAKGTYSKPSPSGSSFRLVV